MNITSCMRQCNELHMSTGLQIFKKPSLCKWIFYDHLYLIYILMSRIRVSNPWRKNVSIMRHTNVFRIIFLRTSQKVSSLEIENPLLHLHVICSIIWKLHVHLSVCEILILWNNTIYLPQKKFLIDLWSFYGIAFFPRSLHTMNQTAFRSQLLNRIHVCQKSLTTYWMIKLYAR